MITPLSRSTGCLVEKYINSDFDHVVNVAEHMDQIKNVEANQANIDNVSDHMTQVVNVSNNMEHVVAVSTDMETVKAVHADEVDIGKVADNITEVVQVANGMEEYQVIEHYTLEQGQTTVQLDSILAQTAKVEVMGQMVDGTVLLRNTDFTVTAIKRIDLTRSYPKGTIIKITQVVYKNQDDPYIVIDELSAFNRKTVAIGVEADISPYEDAGRMVTPRLLVKSISYVNIEPIPANTLITSVNVTSEPDGVIIVRTSNGDIRFSSVLAEAFTREEIGKTATITHPYYAVGGESTITVPYLFDNVQAVYINGLKQVRDYSWEWSKADGQVITIAEELLNGDLVEVIIGGEYEQLLPPDINLSDVYGVPIFNLVNDLVISPNQANTYPKLKAFDAIYELADNSVTYTVKSFKQSVGLDCVITLSDDSLLIAKKVDAASKNWIKTEAKVTAKSASTERTLSDHFESALTVDDEGAIGDGTADDTAAICAFNTKYGFVALSRNKSYLIDTATISGAIKFDTNSALIVKDDATLTINAAIESSEQQIFQGNGSVVFNKSYEIKPQWFAQGTVIGESQTIRGYNAGKKLVGRRVEANYQFIDGYRSAEKLHTSMESHITGCFAGAGLTSSHLSTAVGYGCLRGKEDPVGSGTFRSIVATSSHAFGQSVFGDATSVVSSVGVGSVGRYAETLEKVTAVGANALRTGISLKNISVFGAGAAYKLGSVGTAADSQYTLIFGNDAAGTATKGTLSTVVGERAALYSETLDSNTLLGYLTGAESATYKNVENVVCVGKAARTRVSNAITIGNNTTNTVEGCLLIGDATTTRAQVRGIYASTTANPANVTVDANGVLQRSTSSLKYKQVIEPVSLEWAKKTLQFEPILYKPTEGYLNSEWTYYGYGAEQVEAIDPRYVSYSKKHLGFDENGVDITSDEIEANGVMYERIVVAQQLLIKDLIARVEQLEKNAMSK